MLVLVATALTQGSARCDYCDSIAGELVTPLAVECCSPATCGCGRGFPGLASSRATTTALVVERPLLTPALLRQSVADSLERDGWRCPAGFDALVDDRVDAIVHISLAFGAGAVVRGDGERFWARRPAA